MTPRARVDGVFMPFCRDPRGCSLTGVMWPAACHGDLMAHTRPRFLLVILLSCAAGGTAAADSLPSPHTRRIRTLDARVHALLERGLRESSTLRELAARLEHSDVIVYLLPDVYAPYGLAGRLTFLSATGGVRYVAVRLRALGSPVREVAMLAHELQHAVEIAECASIVDEETLAREYQRIGYSKPPLQQSAAFDTRAAIDTEYRVYRELASIDSAPDVVASSE